MRSLLQTLEWIGTGNHTLYPASQDDALGRWERQESAGASDGSRAWFAAAGYAFSLRRATLTAPIRPVPSRASDEGSGTADGAAAAVDAAKVVMVAVG